MRDAAVSEGGLHAGYGQRAQPQPPQLAAEKARQARLRMRAARTATPTVRWNDEHVNCTASTGMSTSTSAPLIQVGSNLKIQESAEFRRSARVAIVPAMIGEKNRHIRSR